MTFIVCLLKFHSLFCWTKLFRFYSCHKQTFFVYYMLFCLALNCFYWNLLFSKKQDCLRLVLRVDANTSLAYFFGPSFIGFKNKPDRGAYNMFQKSNNEKKLFCHPFLFSLTLNVLVSILPQKYQSQITNPLIFLTAWMMSHRYCYFAQHAYLKTTHAYYYIPYKIWARKLLLILELLLGTLCLW